MGECLVPLQFRSDVTSGKSPLRCNTGSRTSALPHAIVERFGDLLTCVLPELGNMDWCTWLLVDKSGSD